MFGKPECDVLQPEPHSGEACNTGGGGAGGPDPSGKSQIKWVSIVNKQLDTPWKKLDPLEKIEPHLEP